MRVIDKETLAERGINPKEFGVGKMIIKNEYYNVRTLYVPDNFIKDIKINSSKINEKFESEMKKYIEETTRNYPFEGSVFSRNEYFKK